MSDETTGNRWDRLERKVDKHHQDLYEGNGKPSLTTRMELMEECIERISSNLAKLTWLAVSTFLSVVVGVIVMLAKDHIR